MNSYYQQISTVLIKIQAEMQQQGMWDTVPPSIEDLSSQLPFCYDTLTFSQWLQWLFLPKMQTLLAEEAPLPQESNIHAFAEESFKNAEFDKTHLLSLLKMFDDLITFREQSGGYLQ